MRKYLFRTENLLILSLLLTPVYESILMGNTATDIRAASIHGIGPLRAAMYSLLVLIVGISFTLYTRLRKAGRLRYQVATVHILCSVLLTWVVVKALARCYLWIPGDVPRDVPDGAINYSQFAFRDAKFALVVWEVLIAAWQLAFWLYALYKLKSSRGISTLNH